MFKLLMTGVGLAALSTAAVAQQTSAPAHEAKKSTELEEIIVTANRREETTQRSALAIEALSAEELQGVSRPEDLTALTTGVTITAGGNMPQIFIRGVGNQATNNFAEGAAAINIDGVYVSRPWQVRGAFFDLARVEVLKGPQGTLYGRNASGGALNLITARPKLGEFSGYAEVEAGNFDLFRGAAAVNLPLTDVLALRFAGQATDRNGYMDDGYDDDKSQGYRAHLLFEPSAEFSTLFSVAYQHSGGRGSGRTSMPEFAGDPWHGMAQDDVNQYIATSGVAPFLMKISRDGFVDADIYSVSAEVNWDFGPATLTVIPAYRKGENTERFYQVNFRIDQWEFSNQKSLEVRLANETDRLKWVVGAYYFDEDQGNQDGHSLRTVGTNLSTEDIPWFTSSNLSYAAFGQATYSVTDALRLTLGLRYTYEDKSMNGVSNSISPFPPFAITGSRALNGDVSFNSTTYRAGVEYDVAERSMAYATVTTGFKSGGFFPGPAPVLPTDLPNTYEPEKLTAYEVGIKNRFLDNTLQFNVEAFYYDYKDHQEGHLGPTNAPGFYTFIVENAGSAYSYGIALDTIWKFTDSDQVTAGVQWNPTKYKSFEYQHPSGLFGPAQVGCNKTAFPAAVQNIDCSGFPLVRAPKWSGNLAYQHVFGLGNGANITAGVDAQFASKTWLSIDFLPSQQQDEWAMLNANLTYTSPGDRWSASLWGRNLTNESVFNEAFRSPFVLPSASRPDGWNVGTMRPPRTYGARFRVNF